MKMAYKYNDERMTCRDEYGNADIIGLKDVMHEFMLSLDYPNMVHLTEALNRFADLEESKTEAPKEQKTGKGDRMSLIDSNILLPRLWDYISDVDYEKVKKVISEMPLEEQVIRCKDCEHDGYCCRLSSRTQDDYCSHAKRRTDG